MGDDQGPSLQERFAPAGRCFGCGPSNEQGLRIRSFPSSTDKDEVVADWTPARHHEAFEGVLNGGIIGTLLDCHANWTATHGLMRRRRAERPPTTVTRDFAVRFVAPTPSTGPVHLSARVVEAGDDRATVEATLQSGGFVTATCRATFVAVKPGHPAYERW